MKETRIVFFGTPDFAVQTLHALHKAFTVTAVVTQPDRPCGRGKKPAQPPVKTVAEELGLMVVQPQKVRNTEFLAWLKAQKPDFLVTAAYGRILTAAVLNVPKIAPLNVHASLLPRWRGAAPIHRAVIAGDQESGITIMYMDEGMDTGDLIMQGRVPIGPKDTCGQLHNKLAQTGAQLIVDAIQGILAGSTLRVKQKETEAIAAPPLSSQEEEINWCNTTETIHNLVRGMAPWPGAYTYLGDKRLKVREGVPVKGQGQVCGQVIATGKEGILVATKDGAYRITQLQPPGKKSMDAAAFLLGNPLPNGTILGK
jgi:methionyl-tRNA formyltransferase